MMEKLLRAMSSSSPVMVPSSLTLMHLCCSLEQLVPQPLLVEEAHSPCSSPSREEQGFLSMRMGLAAVRTLRPEPPPTGVFSLLLRRPQPLPSSTA